MTSFVHIEPGQHVLAYVEHYYPGNFDGDMPGALECLASGGSGWGFLRRSDEQFEVMQVERVMPKTFRAVGRDRRQYRDLVIAAADTAGELLALRDKLFDIGFAADRAIAEETSRRMADFIAGTRAEALAKIHAALPHIFGRLA